MAPVIVRLLTSTRFITFLVSIAMVLIKKHFPDLGVDEKTLEDIFNVAIAVIIGDTVRPVNPDKPSLIGSKPQ